MEEERRCAVPGVAALALSPGADMDYVDTAAQLRQVPAGQLPPGLARVLRLRLLPAEDA